MARAAPAAGTAAHGVVLVLHDITELRRADQIRRDFVANVSHELRTPLTAIRGYVEALSEDDANAEDRAAVPRDHRAPHAADGAAGQGSAAAGAARRRPGDARRRSPCDTRTLADSGRRRTSAQAAEERRQRVEVTIGPGAEIVRADPAKLHDALRNLVANAITYSPEQLDDPASTRRRPTAA